LDLWDDYKKKPEVKAIIDEILARLKNYFELCKQGKTAEVAQLLDRRTVSVHAKDARNVRTIM